jgi:hypothetical protein
MHSQLFEILMGSLLTPSAACSARSTAATTGSAAERPLLGSGATLGAALPVLPRLSPAAHITKGATRTLRACDPLAATSRPLSDASRTAWAAARASRTSSATHTPRTAGASYTPGAAYTAWASNASRTAWAAGASRTSNATHTPRTAGASYTPDAAYTAWASNASRTAWAAWAGRGPHRASRYRNLRTTGQPHWSARRA